MKEIEYRIIAGILPDVLTRIEVASGMSLTRDNFSDKYASLLWKFISEYYDDHAQIIPLWVLKNKAEKIGLDNGTILTLTELYEGLSGVSVEQHEFKESIKFLKEQELAEKTAEALTTGREILIEGVYDDKNDRTLKGQEDARDYVAEALQELQSYNTDAAPEGDMRDDMEKIWVTYISKEENPDEAGGILYGIEDVDNVTNGIRPGELVLVAGFTGTGKSHTLVNIARNTMLAGKNVLMFTTETTREEMEIRIIARHSREPKFKVPGGLDSHEIMSGTLSSENKEALREVLKDFKSVDGGRLFMVQMPANGSVDYVYTKANQYNRKAPIDIILIDSINLLRASRRYDSKREMLEDMLQAFKRFASSFDNGRGVAIVSPWQMSRAAWKEASDAGGVYTLASLSDTSEAEKCLTPETKVLTPRGWKELGDIEVGEVINDPTGGVQEVITVNDNGRRPLYEVFTRDGMKVTTSPGHIWTVSKDGYHFEDLTTVDIMEGLESGVAEYILPAMQPTQVDDAVWFEQQMYNLPIDFMVEALKNTEVCEGDLVIPTRDPEMLTEFIATVPKYGMVTDPSDTLIRYHYPIVSLEGERTIQCIMEANLFSGNHSEFRIPKYYMALPDYLRIYFLEKFLGLKEGEVDLYDPEQASKYLHLLPYDHPGYGDTLMDMVHSLGLTPDGRPRSITAVKSTGMDDRVICLTVSEPHGLFIVEGMIVTHNSASQILTLYKDGTDESPKLNVQVLKNRSGREMSKVSYPVDFRNSYFDTSGQTSSSNKPSQQSRTRGAVDFTQFMG